MSFSRRNWLSSALLALVLIAPLSAFADLLQVLPEMGDLQRWAVFTLGNEPSGDLLAGNASIQGDVGVAGNGDIALTDTATINGDVYYSSNGSVTVGPNASITGMQFNNQDALLANGVSEARATSQAALAMSRTWFTTTNVQFDHHQSATAAGAPGETVVLQLGNFQLAGNSTFTLQGSATTTFIINIGKSFSLSDNAQIILAGGVQWNNVLFNVHRRNGLASLSGNSVFQGILLANGRTVHLNDQASVAGQVIASRVMFNNSNKSGTSSVIRPPIVSP